MKKIEFIGASGTGKSTLFQEVVKRRKTEDQWITPAEGRIETAKKLSFSQKKSALYTLMLAAIKLDVFKKSHPSMATLLLQKIGKEGYAQKLYEYDPVIHMFLQGIMENSKMESYRKGQFIEFYLNLIETDLIMLEEIGENRLVVYDDGIIHNSEGFTHEEYFNKMIQSGSAVLEMIFPTGVVFCELEEEEVFQRRKNRIAAGKGTMLENNLNDEKLWEVCRESIEESRKIVTILEKHDIPILKIDMNQDQEENLHLISQFIRHIADSIIPMERSDPYSKIMSISGE